MKHWKFIRLAAMLFAIVALTAGCMYPKDQRMENQLSLEEQVFLVQKAINQFQSDKGTLPIVTKEADTPIYEKYVIDFQQMVPRYMPYIPGSSFDQGGHYLFVLTNVETEPTVRLLDLKMVDQVGEIQKRITYYFEQKKSLPVAGVVEPGYFRINFKKIGVSEERATVESKLTGRRLPVIMTSEGLAGIDYLQDIEMIMKNSQVKMEEGKDLLALISENSLYVPVKPIPCKMENGAPSLADRK